LSSLVWIFVFFSHVASCFGDLSSVKNAVTARQQHRTNNIVSHNSHVNANAKVDERSSAVSNRRYEMLSPLQTLELERQVELVQAELFGLRAGVAPGSCMFSFNGHGFDLSELTVPSDYTGRDEKYSYGMNICGLINSSPECRLRGGAICQYNIKTGNYIAMLASWTSPPVYSLLHPGDPSKGLSLRFANGHPACIILGIPYPRETIVNLPCKPDSLGNSFEIVEDDDHKCLFTINFPTPVTCMHYTRGSLIRMRLAAANEASHRLSSGWVFIIMMFVLVPIYVIAGVLYNRHKFGLIGYNAIPHRDFWLQLPTFVTDGGKVTFNRLRSCCCRKEDNEI